MLLRFSRIIIRPSALFIRENYRVTLSCITFSVKICGICGRKNIILLTSNSRLFKKRKNKLYLLRNYHYFLVCSRKRCKFAMSYHNNPKVLFFETNNYPRNQSLSASCYRLRGDRTCYLPYRYGNGRAYRP